MLAKAVGFVAGSCPSRKEFYAALPWLREVPGARGFPSWEFRDPEKNATIKSWGNNQGSNAWHQDCGGGNYLLIVWSNREQTEVREHCCKTRLPAFAPGQIILLDNGLCEHRTPPTITADRTFVRISLTDRHPSYQTAKELLL